jgi:hypothetical protein
MKDLIEALDTVLELAQGNALDEGTCDFELMAQAREHSKALDLVRRFVAELENDDEVYYSEDGSVRYGLKHVFDDAKKFIEKE